MNKRSLLIACLLIGSAQAKFELSEKQVHATKAAGYAAIVLYNGYTILTNLVPWYIDSCKSFNNGTLKKVDYKSFTKKDFAVTSTKHLYSTLLWAWVAKYAAEKAYEHYKKAFPTPNTEKEEDSHEAS